MLQPSIHIEQEIAASRQLTDFSQATQPSASDTQSTGPTSTSADPAMADNNFQNSGFSQQQFLAIQTMIQGAVRGVASGPPAPAGPQRPQGTPAPPATNGGSSSDRWNPQEVGFFDPYYDDKTVATGGAITHAGKDTYYRDVHSFVDRIKDMATVKDAKLVRENLWTCLRGRAIKWWQSILTEDQKRLVKFGEGVDEWARLLQNHFQETASEAMKTLTSTRYTYEDARRHNDPVDYALTITRAAKSTQSTVFNQLYMIYNGLETEFRRDLTIPTENTMMDAFLQEIEMKKEIWWDLAKHSRSSQTAGNAGYGANRNQNSNSNSYRPAGQQGSYQSSAGRPGGSYPTTGYYNQPRQAQFPTPYQYQNQNRTYSQPQQQTQQRPPPPAGGYINRPFQPQAGRGQPFGSQYNQPRQQQQPAATGPGIQAANRNASGSQPYQPNQPFRQNNNPAATGFRPGDFQPNYQNRNFQQPARAYFGEEKDDGQENTPPDDGLEYSEQEYGDTGEGFAVADDSYHGDAAASSEQANRQPDEYQSFFVGTPPLHTRGYTCRRCSEEFPSNKKLHVHLRQCKTKPKTEVPSTMNAEDDTEPTIIKSTAAAVSHHGHGFRSWRYATIEASIGSSKKLTGICVDTGCGGSMGDRSFLAEEIPDYQKLVKQSTDPIRVRGIGNAVLDSKEYLPVEFRIPGEVNGKPAVASFTRNVNIVDGLKAKMLLGNDIIGPEDIVPNVGKGIATIGSCQGLTTALTVTNLGPPVKRLARAAGSLSIPANSMATIPYKLRGKSGLPTGRDFMFNPQRLESLGPEGGILSHIVDAHTGVVQVRNTSSSTVYIPKNSKIGVIQEYEEEGCYLASEEDAHLAANSGSHKPATPNFFKRFLKPGVAAAAAGAAAFVAYQGVAKPTTAVASAATELVTPAGITVYGESPAVQQQLVAVAEAYPKLWYDDGSIVRIPPEEHMPIEIQPDAKIESAKVYPLGSADRKFVDEVFHKLHEQGRMEYTSQPTPHGYPVFVVWRTVPGPDGPERKGRVVVDIRGLNKIAITDSYPIPLQSDITSSVAGCRFISVFDAAGFFHQWLVRYKDRHKLTVVSHRGQEQFSVAVMGFKNSPPYVQRKIDAILRVYRAFARAYVDDIVVFSQTLEEHIANLHSVFQLLDSYAISLSPKKSYLGYPTVALLGQKVDAFGLTTAADKLAAIAELDFPYNLKELETYLGLTGWLRGFIVWYAQKADPLQRRKTLLLRQSTSSKGDIRKTYSRRTVLENPTAEELESYRQLQEAFSRASFLVHFSAERVLFIDIDASKRRGFGAMVYHLKSSADPAKPKRTDVEPILFLSRMLNEAEKRYWPTELETAGLVWVVRRVRHMIEAAKHTTVIFTDHNANASIAEQTTLSSSNTDKLNLRLVRASTYLSQVRLEVKYRPGKDHVVPDALSRLSSGNRQISAAAASPGDALDLDTYHGSVIDPSCPGQAGEIYAMQASLIAISDDFRQRIKDGYAAEKTWSKMLAMLKSLRKRLEKEKRTTDEANTPPATDSQPATDSLPPAVAEDSMPSDAPPLPAREEAENPPTPARDEASPPPPAATGTSNIPRKQRKLHTGIDFELANDGLIYYTRGDIRRICIPSSLEKEIFHQAHDANAHAGIHRCYSRVVDTVFIPRLSGKLRRYIQHCPSCQLSQTKRHRPYGELMPITSPPQPFHTIAMDSIVGLPGEWNMLMTVTGKFSRRVMIIVGKDTWSASQWANALMDRLLQADWGMPAAIVSDRDTRFLSEMWQTFFERMGTALLASTAYHPQTDGSSERTNKTVEIAIRFLVTNYPDLNFVLALPSLQAQLNNSANAATGISPNEIIYGFKVREALTTLSAEQAADLPAQRLEYRQEAVDATAFANAKAKIYYDARHTPLLLNAGGYAYLRLNHGYRSPSKPNKKLSQQRCGPFLVKKRVGRLAYELDLLPAWRIHPVISVAQLEPGPRPEEPDPYNRPRPTHPASVEVEGDTPEYQSYEVEKQVDKRIRKYGRTPVTQYLVRWLGYGPEYDEWRSISALENSMELVEQYEASNPRRPKTAAAVGGRR